MAHPAPFQNQGTVRYRCGIIERQLDTLRLALVTFATSGDDTDARRQLSHMRDQLNLLEAAIPGFARDYAEWRAACDARPPPPPEDPADDLPF